MEPRTIAVAFGSNVGDRESLIRAAAARVAQVLSGFQLSPIIETAAEGDGTAADPPFLNAVGVGQSAFSAQDLISTFLEIELSLGRARSRPNAPRTIDVDLILAGEDVIDQPGVQVPHPRFRGRRFVLEPLAAIAPDLRDPVSGATAAELWERLAGRR